MVDQSHISGNARRPSAFGLPGIYKKKEISQALIPIHPPGNTRQDIFTSSFLERMHTDSGLLDSEDVTIVHDFWSQPCQDLIEENVGRKDDFTMGHFSKSSYMN